MAPRHIRPPLHSAKHTHQLTSPGIITLAAKILNSQPCTHSTRPSIHHARIICRIHSREPGRERAPDLDDFESTVAAHLPGRHPRDCSDGHARLLLGHAGTSAAAERAARQPTRTPRGPPPHTSPVHHLHALSLSRSPPPAPAAAPPPSQACSRVHPRCGSTRSCALGRPKCDAFHPIGGLHAYRSPLGASDRTRGAGSRCARGRLRRRGGTPARVHRGFVKMNDATKAGALVGKKGEAEGWERMDRGARAAHHGPGKAGRGEGRRGVFDKDFLIGVTVS